MGTYPLISVTHIFHSSPPTEAVDILKEMKEKEVVLSDAHFTLIFYMLNALSVKGDLTTLRRLLDTIITLGLAKPSTNLCSPMVTFYLSR